MGANPQQAGSALHWVPRRIAASINKAGQHRQTTKNATRMPPRFMQIWLCTVCATKSGLLQVVLCSKYQ
jgi:hypothetical protein